MEFTFKRTVQITAYLLLALTATQMLFTALYSAGIRDPRQLIWGVEGVIFAILAAVAGAAMVQTKDYHVGWSAIAFGAVLNVVQVSIGHTMFGPFSQAASQVEGLAPAAGAVVALSFIIYNAAKILLGFAALIFGMAKMNAGAKALGGLTTLAGGVAMFANSMMVIFGRGGFMPPPIAGGSAVIATLLLALCLMSVARDHD